MEMVSQRAAKDTRLWTWVRQFESARGYPISFRQASAPSRRDR